MQKWLKAYLLILIVVGAASAYLVLASSFFDLLGRYDNPAVRALRDAAGVPLWHGEISGKSGP